MFDSTEELLRHIRLGEDTSLELKRVELRGARIVGPSRNDLADELAAMANSRGGVVVLGVDDRTREILGIAPEHLDTVEMFVREICNDSIEPPMIFHAFRDELPDSGGTPRPILKVEVPRSLFVHRSPAGYFHRLGSSKREMPPQVLARLFQQRSQARLIPFDEQPVPETGIGSLDRDLWTRLLKGDADPPTILEKLKILTRDSDGDIRATVAGVLAFSRSPERWLSGAFIQAVRYRGSERDANYQIDARDLLGAVDAQIREALDFVRKNMTIAARKDPERVEVPQYSLRAVFEAIVNAVAHRDYSIHGSKIRLFMFDDRLELYSPGPLPNTVTIDSLPLRQSTRNELLTTFLARSPLGPDAAEINRSFMMEKRGEGVPIILAESRRLSGIEPEYRLIDDTELWLTIYAAGERRGT